LEAIQGIHGIVKSDPLFFGSLNASLELGDPVVVTFRATMLPPARQALAATVASGLVAHDSAELERKVIQPLTPHVPRASKQLARFTLTSFQYNAGRPSLPLPGQSNEPRDVAERQTGYPTLLATHWPYLIAAKLPYPPDYRVSPIVWPRQLSRLRVHIDGDDIVVTLDWKRTDPTAAKTP